MTKRIWMGAVLSACVALTMTAHARWATRAGAADVPGETPANEFGVPRVTPRCSPRSSAPACSTAGSTPRFGHPLSTAIAQTIPSLPGWKCEAMGFTIARLASGATFRRLDVFRKDLAEADYFARAGGMVGRRRLFPAGPHVARSDEDGAGKYLAQGDVSIRRVPTAR